MPNTGPIDGIIGWAIAQSSISKNYSQKQKRSMSQLKSFRVFSLGVWRVFDPHSLQALNKVSSFHGLIISQIHLLQVPYATFVLTFINTLEHIFLHSVNQTNNGHEN